MHMAFVEAQGVPSDEEQDTGAIMMMEVDPVNDGQSDISSLSSDEDGGDDNVFGGVGNPLIGALSTSGSGMLYRQPMQENDDDEEEDEDDAEEDYSAARTGGAHREDAGDYDVQGLLDACEEAIDELDVESQRREAWESISELLKMVNKLCHFDSGVAPPFGGGNVIFLAEEPKLYGEDGGEEGDYGENPPNLIALIRSCRKTHRPRHAALARAISDSIQAGRPGQLLEADIRALAEAYNKRADGKSIWGKKEAKLVRLLAGVASKAMAKFKIPHVMVIQLDRSTTYSWGYARNYPVINLAIASGSTKTIREIPLFLSDRRRVTPGHRADEPSDLEHTISLLFAPGI